MATTFRSPIEELVNLKFAGLQAASGHSCTNPVHGGNFVFDVDPIATQKKEAVKALRAREWFAVNGPPDAPPLPISASEVQKFKTARGYLGIVAAYAQSLHALDYDVVSHPPFNSFARGLMATKTGWGLEKDGALIRRFPPLALPGMTDRLTWLPPEKYAEEQRWRQARRAWKPH
jgi:hypothetical protein